jgi:hypothetical protein
MENMAKLPIYIKRGYSHLGCNLKYVTYMTPTDAKRRENPNILNQRIICSIMGNIVAY